MVYIYNFYTEPTMVTRSISKHNVLKPIGGDFNDNINQEHGYISMHCITFQIGMEIFLKNSYIKNKLLYLNTYLHKKRSDQ